MKTVIKNRDQKVKDCISNYVSYNDYEDVTIEEYTRNEAEQGCGFFCWLFDLEEDVVFSQLSEEQKEEYNDFIEDVVAEYED